MGLAPGSRLGPYVITGPLGAGGMGEVYRAHDARLDRDVAIKVLPAAVAQDAVALARFEREARSVAALSHPNILAIHDVGGDGRGSYAVMELLQGETVRERLAHGPLPARKAIEYGARVAHALGAAHQRGIIHRDVKPDNIFITHDGHVKVLDFGLAKPVELAPLADHTRTSAPATSPGTVLGTVGYMAPEQVRGEPVDQRADIFSLGAVLYEMVSGTRAFGRETAAETMTAILKEEPQELPSGAAIPPALERIVRRCLEKNPGERFHSAHDLSLALETLSTESASRLPAGSSPASGQRGLERVAWSIAAVLLLVTVALGARLWRTPPGANEAAPVRFTLRFPAASPMQLGVPEPSLAISPDGTTIVYTALGPEGSQLWKYSTDRFDPEPVPGTGGGPRQTFFSPDGRFVAFFADSKLKRIPLTGGVATVICDAAVPSGGAWTERDEILFSAGADGSLWRVPAGGGTPQRFARGYFYLDALPGGQAVIADGSNPAAVTTSELPIVSIDVGTGDVRPVVAGGTYPRYAASGHVVFMRNGALMAVPFDPRTRVAGETATVVVPNVFMNPAYASANYAISAAGTLAFVPGTGTEFQRGLIAIDAAGNKAPAMTERRFFSSPRVSPDGQRIATSILQWRDSVWIYERPRDVLVELTAGDANGIAPVWTADGSRVVFAMYGSSGPRNLYWMRADGGGQPERLTTADEAQRPNAVTPDGRLLVFEQRSPVSLDLWTLALDESRTARPLLQTRFSESSAALSPDGKWMAYASTQSGRREVYLASFPTLDRTIQVSSDGGGMPVWAPSGRRLYYRVPNLDEIRAVDVTWSPSPTLSRPVLIATMPPAAFGEFDVMPDGRLLLVDNEQAGAETTELRIVLNFFQELRDKAR